MLLDQRIVSAEVLRLFPTFVWKAQLRPEIYGDLNAAILRKLDAIAPPDLAAGSGWQSRYGHAHAGRVSSPGLLHLLVALDS